MKKLDINYSGLQLIILALVLILLFGAASLLAPNFLSSYNMTIIARTLAFLGFITLGQALLMLLGELDLSLGAIGGVCGVISGMLMVNHGMDPWLAMPIAIVIGAIFGLINGLFVVLFNLPSLVLTIAMAGVYSGLNLVLTQGTAVTGIPREIQFLGRGEFLGLPVPFLIMIGLMIVITVLAHRTPFGRYIYTVGDNTPAARMLGVAVDKVRVLIFVIAGALAAVAGVLMVARLGTAQPSIGDSWVLPSIAAAVIGGVPTTGGIGSPFGAILGAAIIGIIQNAIVLYGISPYWQGVVSGAIVVIAISLDAVSRRYFLGRN